MCVATGPRSWRAASSMYQTGIRGFSATAARTIVEPSNRQIDESAATWHAERKMAKHYYSRLFFGALRQSRFSRSCVRAYVQERRIYVYIYIGICLWNRSRIYTHTHAHAPVDGRVYTRTRIVVQAHELPYTLKSGYIGFPVTTNLPRHRAIYISVESIAATKNQ